MPDNNDNTPIYTKEQYEAGIRGTKARYEEKANKELLKENEDLKAKVATFETAATEAKTTPLIKKAYLENGGDENSFNDFHTLSKDELDLTNEDKIKKSIITAKEKRPIFFNGETTDPAIDQIKKTIDDEKANKNKPKQKFYEGTLEPIR